jgi:hypothetical protein
VTKLSRLKQSIDVGAQLRMFAAKEMPIEAVRGALEKDLVAIVRGELERLGYKTWSGRIRIFGRPLDGSEGPPFIPILGPGTPDILGVFPPMSPAYGRMFGLEMKRDLSEKERQSQREWRMMAAALRIPCETFHSLERAVDFLEERRHLAANER